MRRTLVNLSTDRWRHRTRRSASCGPRCTTRQPGTGCRMTWWGACAAAYGAATLVLAPAATVSTAMVLSRSSHAGWLILGTPRTARGSRGAT